MSEMTSKLDVLYCCSLVVIVTVIVLAGGLIAATIKVDTGEMRLTNTWELWECDAPHGIYWVETSATGFLIIFSASSQLMESYTVKYLEGDVLKTQIFASTDPYFIVHLTDNDSLTLERYQHVWKDSFGDESLRGPTTYHLYIPDPSAMED